MPVGRLCPDSPRARSAWWGVDPPSRPDRVVRFSHEEVRVVTADDGVVLVIGCGAQRYREYLLSSAAGRHPVWFFNNTEPTWQSRYVVGSTVVDVEDRDAVIAAARELAGRRRVVGVLSWDEVLVVNVAHVADALGLPGAGVEGIEGCRDKHRSRRLLTAAGLPQPAFGWAGTEAEAVAAAERIGYPVVVKPRGMGASIGVVLAGTEAEVRAAFHTAEDSSYDGNTAYHGGALVEEYVAGPEISVDGATVDGVYRPMFIARKRVGMAPYFEEFGHVLEGDDPLLADPELLRVLAAAHAAIDYRYGITHTEVKLTERGPIIVEINGRLGGDLIPMLGKLATGIDPGVAVVDVALGQEPDLTRTGHDVYGVRFGYPPQDCVVDELRLPEPDPEHGLVAAVALVDPGTELRLPPGGYISRHSYALCTGADPAEVAARLDPALDRIELTWHAVDAAPLAGATA
jgi:biotin carboxylase